MPIVIERRKFQVSDKSTPVKVIARRQFEERPSRGREIMEAILTPKIGSRLLGVPEGKTAGEQFKEMYQIPMNRPSRLSRAYEATEKWPPVIKQAARSVVNVGDLAADPIFANQYATRIAGDILDMTLSPISYAIPPALKVGGKALGAVARRVPIGKYNLEQIAKDIPVEAIPRALKGKTAASAETLKAVKALKVSPERLGPIREREYAQYELPRKISGVLQRKALQLPAPQERLTLPFPRDLGEGFRIIPKRVSENILAEQEAERLGEMVGEQVRRGISGEIPRVIPPARRLGYQPFTRGAEISGEKAIMGGARTFRPSEIIKPAVELKGPPEIKSKIPKPVEVPKYIKKREFVKKPASPSPELSPKVPEKAVSTQKTPIVEELGKKEAVLKGIKGETPKRVKEIVTEAPEGAGKNPKEVLVSQIDQALHRAEPRDVEIKATYQPGMNPKIIAKEPPRKYINFRHKGMVWKIENNIEALTEFKNRIETGKGTYTAIDKSTRFKPAQKSFRPVTPKLTDELGFSRIGKEPIDYSKLSLEELKAIIKKTKILPRREFQAPKAILPPKPVLEEPAIKRPGEVVTHETPSGKILPVKSKSGITIPKELVEGAENWKDLTKLEIQFLDQTRQIEKVTGPQAGKLKEFLVKPREQAVTNLVNEKYARMADLKQSVIKNFGIRQKTKESAAVQKYGEGRLSLDDLKKQFPDKWQNIVKAERYFRTNYDELLTRLNEVQIRNGYKPTPRRKDYFTHFQETANFFEQMMQAERGIETQLAGISEVTQPGRPFVPFRLPRKGAEFVDDAIRGYSRYINPVLSEIHLTDSVARLRTFKRALAESTKQTKNVNNFLIALRDSADQLALKKNRMDTVIQDNVIGYRALKTVDWIRRRLGKNAILYNVSSALSNVLPLQQLLTEIGPARTLKALYSAFADRLSGDFALKNSPFLQRRFKDIDLDDIDPRIFKRMELAGAWLFRKIDGFISRAIWSGLYDRALRRNVSQGKAIQIADEEINKIMAGRAIGEIPTAFTSRLLQIGLQFQTEVNNYMNYAFRDIGLKDPRKLGTLFVYAWLMNTFFEKIMNRRPLFDPIDAALEAFQSKDFLQGSGRLIGEGLSNLPGGQLFANLYPQYGMQISGFKLPTREKFFGRSEAGRFGPVPLAGVYRAPITSLAFPFGGAQVRKTFGGLKAASKGVVKSRAGKRLFGLSGPVEAAQSLVFGPYSTGSARQFFETRSKKRF